jgi:ankyrin repeat protein
MLVQEDILTFHLFDRVCITRVVNVRDRNGFTPLQNVLHYQKQQSVESSETCLKSLRMLLEHGAEVDAVAPGGLRPLFWPLRSGMHVVVNILLKHGADPTQSKYSWKDPVGVRA